MNVAVAPASSQAPIHGVEASLVNREISSVTPDTLVPLDLHLTDVDLRRKSVVLDVNSVEFTAEPCVAVSEPERLALYTNEALVVAQLKVLQV